MATPISLPRCLSTVYPQLFPTLDFSRIQIFDGFPPGFDNGQNGLTLSSGWHGIHIHLRSGIYDPCTPHTFALLGHELVHALLAQQGLLGGRANSWVFSYVWCWASSSGGAKRGEGNAFEDEAYAYEDSLADCLRAHVDASGVEIDPALAPCDCRSGAVLATRDFAAVLLRRCPSAVKVSANAKLQDCLDAKDLGSIGLIWGTVAFIPAIVATVIWDLVDIATTLCEWIGICDSGVSSPTGPGEKSGKGPKRIDDYLNG